MGRGWQARDWQKLDGQAVANADLWRPLMTSRHAIVLSGLMPKEKRLEGLERAGLRLLAVV